MKALWISYPSSSDSYTSHCVLIPALGETWEKKKTSHYLKEGNKSAIGNRSCTHLKASINLSPLKATYNMRPMESTRYYFLKWTTTGLPRSRWSALLADVSRRISYFFDYGTYSIKYEQSFVIVKPGVAVFIRDYTLLYDDPAKQLQSGYTEHIEHFHTQRAVGAATVDTVTTSTKTTAAGVTTTYQTMSVPSSGLVVVETEDRPISPESLWKIHGPTFLWYATTFLNLRSAGELANDCATKGDKAYQTSSAQYLYELKDLASVLRPLRGLMEGTKAAKSIAAAWLTYNYGVRQTMSDSYNIVSGIVRSSGRRVMDYDVLRSRSFASFSIPNGIQVSGYRALTIYHRVHSNWVVETYRAMRRYGLNPSTKLAWDLVPLSFVVDWFIPIGEVLDHFDGIGFYDSLSIIESLSTDKYEYVIPASQLGYSDIAGEVILTYYDRNLSAGSAPKPKLTFKDSDFSGMNFVNGTALTVQRLR